MGRMGFIHDALDLKILILYLMNRLIQQPVPMLTITSLAQCDWGVNYFDTTMALTDLVKTGHLTEAGQYFTITDKGRRNGAALEDTLAYSVRMKCDDNLARVNAERRRMAQIHTEVTPLEGGGGYTLLLGLDDNIGNLLQISLYVGQEEHAKKIAARFTEAPEKIYHGMLDLLLPDELSKPKLQPVVAAETDEGTDETPEESP